MTMIRRLSVATALMLSVAATVPVQADGLVGAYLAGRHASAIADYPQAASYFTKALVRDPNNPILLEGALLAHVGQGKLAQAVPFARQLRAVGTVSEFADLVLLADALKRKDYDLALADLAGDHSVGPLADGLVAAWANLGQGKMSEAIAKFDATAQLSGLTAFGLFHKGLAMASVGDFEGADAIFSGREAGPQPLTRRGVVAHVEVLSQLERNADAIELIDKTYDTELDTGFKALRARLVAGEVLPFDLIRDPADGEAEVFLDLALALNGDAEDSLTLVYARVAQFLRPEDADTILLTSDLLAAQQQYDLAGQVLATIPQDDAAFVPAELGRADALAKSGKTDAAVEVLQQLAKNNPDAPTIQVTLGDMLRRDEHYEPAIAAYDQALALLGAAKPNHWVIYYTRGIAHERLGHMDVAESDMRKALELNPDRPEVLNYLGYAFVDANRNLDEALSMIERAVAARPDDGYIIDSLGWALYRMGRFDEALEPMERAAEIEAVDPIVNDHLGDVYWVVGRQREAAFQWRRALSFGPEAEDEARIKRKLAVGLDIVLQEEGATPPAVAADGN